MSMDLVDLGGGVRGRQLDTDASLALPDVTWGGRERGVVMKERGERVARQRKVGSE